MQNDIIKNSSVNNINEQKEEINKKQLEESQKKSIEDNSSLERIINKDEEMEENSISSHISLKDYSKKIRYDEIQGNSSVEDTSYISENSYTQSTMNTYIRRTPEEKISYNGNVSSREPFAYNDISSSKIINDRGNTENIIKTNDNAGGVIRTNESSIIKDTQNNFRSESKKVSNNTRPNRLKNAYNERAAQNNASESNSDISYNQTNNHDYQTESNYDYSDSQSYENNNYIKNQQFQSNVQNNRHSYSEDTNFSDNNYSKASINNDNGNISDTIYQSNESNQAFNYIDRDNDVNIRSNKSDIDYRQIDVDVKPEISQVLNSEVVKTEKTKFAESTRKNRLKSAYKSAEENRQNQENSYETFKYHDDTYINQNISYSDDISSNQSIKYVDDTFFNEDIKYIDESVSELKDNEIILNENRIEDIINSDVFKNEEIIEKTDTKLKEAIKRKKRLERSGIKEQENKIIKEEHETKINEVIKENYNSEKLGIDKEINNQSDDVFTLSAKNKNFENEIINKTTTKDTVFSEKISGEKRNLNLNRTEISKKAEMLGIKKKSADSIKESITQYNNDTKQSAISITSFAKRGIRNMIVEHSDDDVALKGANATIKAYETGKIIYSTSTKVADLGKEIVTTPKEIYKGTKIIKARLRKAQKFMRMSRANKLRYTKVYVKTAVNNTVAYITDTAVKTAKSLAVKVIGGSLAALLLIVVISSAILIILTSFMWQTTSDLDTTQMIKYIAELDYDQQNTWFSKGETAVRIAEKNEYSSTQTYRYHYLLAVDVPCEVGIEDNIVKTDEIHCYVRTGMSSGKSLYPTYSGFNKEFSSKDEMLENYRWTTDDYYAALAYLQVKNDNLGWFESLFGWVGKAVLKSSARELHEATYNHKIVHEYVDDDDTEYSFANTIFSSGYSKDGNHDTFYFGRKYSVKYLIDNDMIRFDNNDEKNKKQKEQFENVYKYGNIAVANLTAPLELDDDEEISDRIVKHFGKQLYLEYEPPEPPSDSHDRVFGSISKHTGYHYAVDLKADSGDVILAPISGLCKAKQRDGRGFEYSICTALNDAGTEFDFTKKGYLVKISCSSVSYIPTTTAVRVEKGTSWLGKVSAIQPVNYEIPDMDNDTENEDIFADKLFPCFTGTDFQSIDSNDYSIPSPQYEHIHLEMYKLPCDFNDRSSIEENVLDPELFFERQNNDE